MTKDFATVNDKAKLPTGMAHMAALITRGSSPFGYDVKRDGLPEVVVRAYARIGPEGLRAIGRLAYQTEPIPTFSHAAALAEWGIEHYAGHRKGMKSTGLDPEHVACGQLFKDHVTAKWGDKIASAESIPVDWQEWIDWERAAFTNAADGKVTFVHWEDKHSGEFQVDMFEGKWELWMGAVPTPEEEIARHAEAKRRLEVYDAIAEFVATYEETIQHEEVTEWTRGYDSGVDVTLAELRELLKKGLK